MNEVRDKNGVWRVGGDASFVVVFPPRTVFEVFKIK
jgi:hypothetical protein